MPLKPNLHRFFKFTCNGKYSHKDIDRFISKIDTTSSFGPWGNCWIWNGGLHKNGYGQFSCRKNTKSITYLPHRVAKEIITNKLIPSNMCACHSCDNRKCVNPYHLWLGTNQDNIKDRDNKGRGNQASGENQGFSKLNWELIEKIRKEHSTGKYSQQQLAIKFSVHQVNISCIVRNKTWYNKNYTPNKLFLGRGINGSKRK
jgi:hypothetical protein